MDLSEAIRREAEKLLSASDATLADALNRVLCNFLGPSFLARSGLVVDLDGKKTESFASVIHTSSGESAAEDTSPIPADNVAAVVEACDSLDLEGLGAGFDRIAMAKRLKKNPAKPSPGIPRTTRTLGLIFALRSDLPLDALADELDRLNSRTPGMEWPDMVVVGSTGIINYGVQFPGEGVSDDFLPPAEGELEAYTPPMYVVMVMRPAGDYSFNKMVAYLIRHLAIFSPSAGLPDASEIAQGIPGIAVTLSGYQHNLRGELVPVPRQMYNDRYLPPRPMRIEDQRGKLLSTIQFLPWQDGGAIILEGTLPLDPFLAFLGERGLRRSGVVSRPGRQISYVLPINESDFGDLLAAIQRRSNMVVRPPTEKLFVQKLADEGSQSPFMVRLLMGIMRLRDAVYPDPGERKAFDEKFEDLFSSLTNARATASEILRSWKEHRLAVASVRVEGGAVHGPKAIDKELRRDFESFLNTATRALKQEIQNLAQELHLDIGFLFKKSSTFDAGLKRLSERDPHLADYLREARLWTERLIGQRNALEHKGWVLPKVTYVETTDGVMAGEPPVSEQSLTEFVSSMLDRLICLVEDVTAHGLQKRMRDGITVTEIPLAERESEVPERFTLTLSRGGLATWRLSFHESPFEQT